MQLQSSPSSGRAASQFKSHLSAALRRDGVPFKWHSPGPAAATAPPPFSIAVFLPPYVRMQAQDVQVAVTGSRAGAALCGEALPKAYNWRPYPAPGSRFPPSCSLSVPPCAAGTPDMLCLVMDQEETGQEGLVKANQITNPEELEQLPALLRRGDSRAEPLPMRPVVEFYVKGRKVLQVWLCQLHRRRYSQAGRLWVRALPRFACAAGAVARRAASRSWLICPFVYPKSVLQKENRSCFQAICRNLRFLQAAAAGSRQQPARAASFTGAGSASAHGLGGRADEASRSASLPSFAHA